MGASLDPRLLQALAEAEAMMRQAEEQALPHLAAAAAQSAWNNLAWWCAPEDPTPMHFDLAREVLDQCGAEDLPLARDRLARALILHARKLRRAAGMDQESPDEEEEALRGEGGLLLWTARAAAFLRAHYRATGKTLAGELEAVGRDLYARVGPPGQIALFEEEGFTLPGRPHAGVPWSQWFRHDDKDHPTQLVYTLNADGQFNGFFVQACAVVRLLAIAVWEEQVRHQVEEDRQQKFPILVRKVRDGLGGWRRGAQVEAIDGGGSALVATNGAVVALFPATDRSNLEAVRRGIEAGKGVLLDKTLRALVRDAYHQAVRGLNPYNRLAYRGGWSRFAERIGIGDKGRRALPDLFAALKDYRGSDRTLPPALDYWTQHPSGRREGDPSAVLWVDVGQALAPSYVHQLPKEPRQSRHLLPVLDVPYLGFAAPNEHADLLDFQWALIESLREGASTLAEEGGVPLADLLPRLVQRLDLKPARAEKALLAWSDPEAPHPWLRRTGAGLYTFADPDAERVILDAAALSKARRRQAAAQAARKRRRR